MYSSSIIVSLMILLIIQQDHHVESMSIITTEEQNNSLDNYLQMIFPFETSDLGQMALSAMNPVLNNRTLIDLYSEASEIVNATGADSVLMEIDSKNSTNNNTMVVLAVNNPNVPTHEDLMKKFHLYFVNLTEGPMPNSMNKQEQYVPKLSYSQPTYWQIFVDLIRNQANAIFGAMMIPINVGADAILKATQTHSEYVMSGSSFGSVVSAPVILKAISIPNIISQHATDMASHQLNNVQAMTNQAIVMVDNGIQSIANGVNNGTNLVTDVTDQYVIRPIGAFTGFNLDAAGTHLAHIGESFANTGLNIHLFGERLNSGAVKVVSAGATAIAWGLDDTVNFNLIGNSVGK